MGNINYHFLRPVGQSTTGLPQLMQPFEDVNGTIHKNNNGYKFQYQPSDHINFETPDSPRNLIDYKETDILYTVNEQCFRGSSFDKQDDAIMSAGCSHTYGIGQRDGETWSYKTARKLGLENWNIGCGGIGADVVALLVRQFFEEGYIPKVLCVLWPPHERTLLRLDAKPVDFKMFDHFNFAHPVWQFTPGSTDSDIDANMYDVASIRRATKSHLLKSNAQMLHEFWLARQSVIDLCKIHGVQLVEMFSTFNARDYIKEKCTQNIPTSPLVLGSGITQLDPDEEPTLAWDLGRDGLHFGSRSTGYIADEFLSQINLDQL